MSGVSPASLAALLARNAGDRGNEIALRYKHLADGRAAAQPGRNGLLADTPALQAKALAMRLVALV